MSLVVGIDPGGHCGWAALSVMAGRWSWLDGDWCEPDMINDVLRAYRETAQLLVVETPVALHLPQANVALIATAVLAGEVKGAATEMGFAVLSISPAQWRAALIGAFKRGGQDVRVKRELARMVEKFPKQTSVHARDAAGAAIIGWEMFRRRQAA